MRKLHLVGLTTDRDGLIFTARKGSKSGGYIVPINDAVLAAIAAARDSGNGTPAAPAPATDVEPVPKRLRSQSALTPREMQARLRAGRSIEEVAAEAGVDTEWVARFAVPILAEQAQVVELARALVYAKPRLGESSQPLGASVMQNLADRGIVLPDDVVDAGWSAFQLHDSIWMVRFRYRSRGRDQEAYWEIDVPAGRLLARNRHASDLGYVEPGRRRRDIDTDDEAVEGEPAARPARPPARRPSSVTTKAKPRARTATGGARPAPLRRSKATTAPKAKAATPRGRRLPDAPARSATKAPKVAKVTKAPTGAKPPRASGAPKAPVPVAKSPTKSPTKSAAKSPTKSAGKGPKAAVAKSPARRRSAKAAAPGAEPGPTAAGPTAGTGGVRMAVAHVSAARVAASMAAVDREPWSAVRRPAPRPAPRPTPEVVAEPEPRVGTVRPFEPRPLPPPGQVPLPPRVRKVSIPRPEPPTDGPPTLTLPTPLERSKRRRLRSR